MAAPEAVERRTGDDRQPNFGMRSYFRDMESQLYMVSESENYILE